MTTAAGEGTAGTATETLLAAEGIAVSRRGHAMGQGASVGVKARQGAALHTRTTLSEEATHEVGAALTTLLADMFALYIKTRNFHWHVSGPHFRDYHLMLDEQADQILAVTDALAERVRKIGGATIHSVGHIARLQRVLDNDADYVAPLDMLAELRDDNVELASRMRQAHGLCEERGDVASAGLLETWVDEAERRAWFLFESSRKGEAGS